ncbi:MAG: signal peptidase I [Castellaniella sp.]|uniref:signal peptidase I n=1 Tax=Castellaniella sp. TaxID=1955812 RepID=UPI00120E6298|nr:signal peptidase I [Castellaniella sp.]TAN30261.1 MAG: signal peptidase I [Castellaniella sp.]
MSWDFALLLFVALIVTGLVWLLDRFRLRKLRRARAEEAVRACRNNAAGLDVAALDAECSQVYEKTLRAPWWVEYCVSFFPVILFVFVLRSFVVEPFRIPSGSMLPTLENGDMILVNKFEYGIRLPVIDRKIISLGKPHRGDVMVFRYPVDPSVDYIKRVIGVPGDVIEYRNKVLTINGQLIPHERAGDYFEPDRAAYVGQYHEQLGPVSHQILLNANAPQDFMPITHFPDFQACTYLSDGIRCTVPAGHYFMMGDNRDNSLDSRYWGFVPDANIVGRAFFIWMNFGSPSRIGRFK